MLQSSRKGPYKIVIQIDDVVYRIQRNSRSMMMVVHKDRLAPHQALREQLESNHRESRATGKEGEANHTLENKWWYACRLFGMNILKEGAMWHIFSRQEL
jgi:hypothetical protein